jgi:hypothetical protein
MDALPIACRWMFVGNFNNVKNLQALEENPVQNDTKMSLPLYSREHGNVIFKQGFLLVKTRQTRMEN